ncbi:MAG: GGDEF domain-containing protein [Zetaproteobacteria bacterium]|nr:MAG: GGDEF domain-containing protein [Zetaproteobacteria bacterium]
MKRIDFGEVRGHASALHDLLRDHKDRRIQHHLRKLVLQLEMMEEAATTVPESARTLAAWLARLCDAEHGALVRRWPGEEDPADALRIEAHVALQKERLLAGAALQTEVERGVKHMAGMLGIPGARAIPVAERIAWFAEALLEHLRQDRETIRQLHRLAQATMESLRAVQQLLLGLDEESPELQQVSIMLARPVPEDPVAARAHLQRINDELQQAQRRMIERGRRMRSALDARVRDLSGLSDRLSAMERQARSDSLTGLPNRRALKEFLADQPPGRTMSLAMIDIDRLREINTAGGREQGDRALCAAAEAMAARLRAEDLLFRIGGDEFVALFPGIDADHALQAARGLLESVCARPSADGQPGVRISVGVAERRAGEKPLPWLKRADAALYVAKGRGGGCVELAP